MTVHEYTCPKCGEKFSEDFGPAEVLNIDEKFGVLCPGCKSEILFGLLPADAAKAQAAINTFIDEQFEKIFHTNPAAVAAAKEEYRRLAPTGDAIDPRD